MRDSVIIALVSIGLILALSATATAADVPGGGDTSVKTIRAGIIGLDTSHVQAFTKLLNTGETTGDLAGIKVVAAFPGGSKDIAASRDRVDGYTKDLKGMGVEIVDSIPALLEKVDVVMLESVDGRVHLDQIRPVFAAGKPVFIDKPLAGSLADAIAIDALARRSKVAWFSSSALRFCTNIPGMKHDERVGEVLGCTAWSPCHLDLFWYGIHGVELLYAVMGPGCETVTRTQTDSAEVVVGTWKDGRIGTFRGVKKGKLDYGSIVYGSKGIVQSGGYDSYRGLLEQVGRFFKTGHIPVENAETIEVMAFMEAADESKRQQGKPVKLSDVMNKAREEAKVAIGN